ncbi:MAG: SDR family NAD(P)-dependent oxidoreductase [Corynebacteriales bacterium]|nr:SDR family NAD(P)-dependent oxidoreductase [Mycobacteriales bacterium]
MAESEPIAVVGIGCRLPGGANDPSSLWSLLTNSVDAIGPIPQDRWDVERFYSPKPQQPGRMSAREGGFLASVDTFDAGFFGISGRVAEQMDPQQRVLLEVAWTALEDAGVVPDTLAGGKTGVFIGACSQDYGGLQSAPNEVESLGAHSATGTFMSILSNRLSYTLDLNGPSMTIDTACSSSLVAVHLACQSLHRGESELAIAGGVNIILTPQFAIALSQAAMLSPDARSRAFDASANGYVRGEGAGVVILKPLSHALRDRDRIYALIEGSAVNQDGRTQGITLPSGAAQETNFREALRVAGIAPHEIGYVEAHGTGTPVGDPIEANALGRVLGEKREELAYLGSIKTNIGHLEAGAGIAGLIKAVLSVHHRQIPPSLHFRSPNPEIDFTNARMTVPTSAREWPHTYSRALAAVNSFGFGGTNANVIVGQAPAPASIDTIKPALPTVLAVSARNEQALRERAMELAEYLEAEPVDLPTLGAYLALRRSHHNHRLSLAPTSAAEAAAALRGYAAEGVAPGVITGTTRQQPGKVAFLFNGQGPQWYAMGRKLLETSDVYRAKILECDELARPYLDWSIYETLMADEESSRVQETHRLQPTMFALQVALAELWKQSGITPDAVLGHSMGEIAAAHVSGALDLSTALKVICHRSRIQEKADPTGAMMFVALSKAEAAEICARYPNELWISAENSPRASTLSGRKPRLEHIAAELTEQGVFARILKVNCACHSQDMEPLRDELVATLADVQGVECAIPMYSTVLGARIEGTAIDTAYWWDNFRKPVLFEPGVRALLEDGFDTFVELSPHPVLGNSLKEIFADASRSGINVASLSRNKEDWSTFLEAFGALYVSGTHIDWNARYPSGAPALDAPTNPWIRERYWNESEVSQHSRAGGQLHPMLKRVDAVRPTWEIRWDDHRLTWVKEHDVFGSIIVPGAAYVEAALAAAAELTGMACGLDFVDFERACVLDPEDPRISRIELNPDDGTFVVHHRSVRTAAWTRAVRGRFHRVAPAGHVSLNLDEIKARCVTNYSAADVYGVLREKGYEYGPAFCGIDRFSVGQDEALARIRVPRVLRKKLDGYLFHPAIVDACFQSAILHPDDTQLARLLPHTFLPTGIESVRMHGDVSTATWCYTKIHKLDASGLSVSIYVLIDAGHVIAEYERLVGKVVPQSSGDREDHIHDHLYQLRWLADRDARPAQAPSALTRSLAEIGTELKAEAATLSRRLGRHSYANEYQDLLAELCTAYVSEYLAKTGLRVGQSFTVQELKGLSPRYTQAVNGYLRFLVHDGVLTELNGVFTIERDATDRAETLWARAFSQFPSCVWELLLLQKTGSHLHEILSGQADPLALLFPAGSSEETEPIYQSSPIAQFYNKTVENVVRRLVENADPDRTIRVLEVGAGTGGLTTSVLRALPDQRCEYVFTDVSAAFLQAAQERFGAYDFVQYRTLDIEKDLEEQGIEPGSFDVVLASDVVHATPDLKRTLLHLQDVLAPGGVLAMIEAAPGNRWLDLTFGLTVGWWSFRDLSLRQEGPLLTAPVWLEVLKAAGYTDVVALGDPEHERSGAQNVLLARAPQWEPARTYRAIETQNIGHWVIVSDESDPLAPQLHERIAAQGGSVTLFNPGQNIQIAPETQGVIDLVSAEASEFGADACLTLTKLLQQLDEPNPSVFVLTRGAHSVRGEAASLLHAPVWGFGTVAALEYPHTAYTMVDLPVEPLPDEADQVWTELWGHGTEREIALRAGGRFVRRLSALPHEEITPPVPARELNQGYTLELTTPGALDGLRFVETPRVAPGAGQVEVRVVAAGLNFLDVMIALGQVPPLESADAFRFGAECAGIVTQVGEGVEDIAVGDAVIAVNSTQGALGSHLTLDATNVVAKPQSLTFEEAAGIPIVFLTAWYALNELARVKPGDRVLIHAAAGGTGLAAIQIAQRAGAEVFATAGSPQKRALLRSLGVTHVMDSRSLDFVQEIADATSGQGVDVVVNSIAGEAATRSLDCLAPYGRFVEIGKRDFLDDRRLGLRPFLRNLSYFSFDLRQLLVDRPQHVHAELATLMRLFEVGDLTALPYREFHPDQTRSAFRHMAGARHIGKLVVAMDEKDVLVETSPMPMSFDGTWLITGGLGGFGLAMADALADSGAESVVLLGRSGITTAATQERVDALRARGIKVLAESVDVSDRDQLAGLLARVSRELPPLAGVLHCAMVLEDALIADMDEGRLNDVIAPKAAGAWHLHELTAHMDLRAFVLFSSATSMVGNTGQANYGAANAFLDHLAQFRKAQGLPALAINWGAISDAGYVARHADVAKLVAATGMREFSAARAFEAMSLLMSSSRPNVGVLPMDWSRFFTHHGFTPENQPRYADLYQTASGSTADELVVGGSLLQQMRAQSEQARGALLRAGLKARVATVLGMPTDELDDDKPLMDYLDSLLADEISVWLERELDAKVTILELMKGPSLAQLSDRLLADVNGAG